MCIVVPGRLVLHFLSWVLGHSMPNACSTGDARLQIEEYAQSMLHL